MESILHPAAPETNSEGVSPAKTKKPGERCAGLLIVFAARELD